jgi:hypothetical protein
MALLPPYSELLREALSMSLEAYLVAEMLQRMEQQIPVIRPQAVEIATALSKDEYPAARHASAELLRALDSFVTATQMLQDHVVANDGLGRLGESLGELALRGRGLVLLSQLDALCTAFRAPEVQVRAQGWFGGEFQGIAEVRARIRDRLTKIHAIWTPYRRDQPPLPGMTDAERTTVYRTMVRVAQRELRSLRDEPDLARFLRCGIAANDLPDVQLPCKQIDAMLGLQIDVEPARPLACKPSRITAQDTASESR